MVSATKTSRPSAGFSTAALRHQHHKVIPMASHVLHEIFLHITWHTKDDSPLLTPSLEPVVHKVLTNCCHETKGAIYTRLTARQRTSIWPSTSNRMLRLASW